MKTTRIVSLCLPLLLCFVTAIAQYWEPVPGAIDRSSGLDSVFAHTDGTLFAWSARSWYRSTDRGATWQRMADANGYGILRSGPDGALYSLTSHELRRSTDRGASWTRVSTLVAGAELAFAGADTMWVLQDGRPHRSTDRGATWRRIEMPLSAQNVMLRMAIGGGGRIAARSEIGLYTSSDDGVTWDTVANRSLGAIFGLAYDPANNLYVSFGERFQRSTDNGATWTFLDSTNFISMTVGRSGELHANVISYNNRADLDGIIRSTDGGATWTTIYRGLVTGPAIGPDGALVATTGMRVRISTDGGITWPTRNAGISDPSVISTVAGPDGALYAFARSETMHVPYYPPTGYALYRSTDAGATWTFLRDSVHADLLILPNGTLITVQVSSERAPDQNRTRSTLIRSDDGGATWSRGPTVGGDIEAIVGDGQGNVIAVNLEELGKRTGTTGILRSTDDGRTWAPSGHRPSFTAAAVAPDGTFFAIYNYYQNSPVITERFLYRSTDHGATWTSVLRDTAVDNILIASDGTVYANIATTQTNYLLRSSDNGTTWTRLRSLSYADVFVRDSLDRLYLALSDALSGGKSLIRSTDRGQSWRELLDSVRIEQVVPGAGRAIYLQTEKGLLRSTDDGESWASFALGLPVDDGYGQLTRGSDGRLYSSGAFGVYRSTTAADVAAEPSSMAGGDAPRLAVLPNPVVGGSATMLLTLPRAGAARVELVDRLGHVLATIGDSRFEAGRRSIAIDGGLLASLPGGIYWCRVTTEEGAATAPVIVAR